MFLACTLDQNHHLLVKFSCKSACENLDAISARSAICLLQAVLQFEQEVNVAAIMIALFIFTRL